MGLSAVALLSIFVVAWQVAFVSTASGLRTGRRLLQQSALPNFQAELAKLQPNKDIAYDNGAWTLGAGAARLSPPPPRTTFGRAQISPVTAAVGLIIAGFATGLMVVALVLWIWSAVGIDFRLKDLIMVWLGRRRQMPVMPADALPRAAETATEAEAAAAAAAGAAAPDAGQGEGRAAAQEPQRSEGAAVQLTGSGISDAEGRRRPGSAAVERQRAAGSGADMELGADTEAGDGRVGGPHGGGEIVSVVARGGPADYASPAMGAGPAAAAAAAATPAYRTAVEEFGEGAGVGAGASGPGAGQRALRGV